MQGASHGTRSRVSRTKPWAEGGAKLLIHPGCPHFFFKKIFQGSLGGAVVWRLPLAQGTILETWDRIPRRAPGAWSLLLPLPMSLPPSLSFSLCLS